MNNDICKCISINDLHVSKAKEKLKNTPNLENASKFFKVLGDKTRFKIIAILLDGEMCVCDIASSLNMSHSSISHQLKILRENKVLKNRKDGKIVYYSFSDEHVKNIVLLGLEHQNH